MQSRIINIESIRPQAGTLENQFEELNVAEKKNFSFIAASKDGYLRVFVCSSKNSLEIVC